MVLYLFLMVSICSNGYLSRYASNWANFQLKWSIFDPNRCIFGNWPMGYWGGGPLPESSRCRQELRPNKKKNKPPNGSMVYYLHTTYLGNCISWKYSNIISAASILVSVTNLQRDIIIQIGRRHALPACGGTSEGLYRFGLLRPCFRGRLE